MRRSWKVGSWVPWGLLLSTLLEPCAAQSAVELQSAALNESSGVAISTLDPQIVWTHNDSGDIPRLFAFTRGGQWIAELKLQGAAAVDWEDMCSFQRDGKSYLAVGDVGDNLRKRTSVVIYILEEPPLLPDPPLPKQLAIADFERIEIQFSSGAVNCESLAYDPLEDRFLLATKELLRCRLYSLAAQPNPQGAVVVASHSLSLGVPLVTAADISSDGRWLVLATYGPACLLRRGQCGRWDASEGAVQILELPARKQGESICFADENAQLLLTSEFAPTPLWSIPFEGAGR